MAFRPEHNSENRGMLHSEYYNEDKQLSSKLKDITRDKIAIDGEMWKRNMAIVEDLKIAFISEMKTCDNKYGALFNALFTEIYHTGSSYTKLKISEPNEFDLDLMMELPFRQLQHWFSEDSYLMMGPFYGWFRCLVDSVIGRIEVNGVHRIRRETGAPAVTLIVEHAHGSLSIDFVPVFKIEGFGDIISDLRRVIAVTPNKVDEIDKFLMLVPKRNKDGKIRPRRKKCLWRLDYPSIEKKIIHDVGCVKLVIKLLKLLRDELNMTDIASYHLKTLMMHEILQHPDLEYWSEENLGPLFMCALEKWSVAIENKNIPYLFDERANLLQGKISNRTAKNDSNRIKNLITKIRLDHNHIYSIFNNQKWLRGMKTVLKIVEYFHSEYYNDDKKLSSKLKDITKDKITMDDAMCKGNMAIVEDLKSAFILEMKNSKNKPGILFNELFTQIYHTGSSYTNLRISEPTEFDLDLMMKLPFEKSDYEFITNTPASFH
ncbi:Cyclic GMP-AMP synthase [Nymphon striatum]|nr:Cyclic GMP-AMP synthase [Nymphon striatum]